MFCKTCNKHFSSDSLYCSNCGKSLINTNNNKLDSKQKKKTKIKIILLIVIALMAIIASTIFFVISLFNYLNKIGKLEYIQLGNDKIPTIYLSNNIFEIDSYEKDIDEDEIEVKIEYYDDLYQDNMINKYISYLEEFGFNYIVLEDGKWYLVKESNDIGKLLFIHIYEKYDYDGGKYFTVLYEKELGDINNYLKKITYKRVGGEKFGYIDVLSNWQPYVTLDNDETLQYYNENEFLTLYYIENPNFTLKEYMTNVHDYLYMDGIEDLYLTEVTVDNYNAYQISGYYSVQNIYLVIWCFIDEKGIIHYIEFNSDDYNSEIFSKIESYSVLK